MTLEEAFAAGAEAMARQLAALALSAGFVGIAIKIMELERPVMDATIVEEPE
jgi:hypothetical protein